MVDDATAAALDAKFNSSSQSPHIKGSMPNTPQGVIDAMNKQINDEFRRYAAVINSPDSPLSSLTVIVNEQRIAQFFQELLVTHGVPGKVVVKE